MDRIIAIVIVVALIFGIVWFDAHMQARVLNERYGTDYTTREIFWLGNKIIISDHVKTIGE